MSPNHWMAVTLGAILIIGCAKKPEPPPPPEPEPPVVEEPAPPPEPEVDLEAERRARIQQRINEVFRPIYFAFDEASITSEGRATLSAVGDLMKEYPEITVRAEGHADERGTNEYNLALGDRRANSVKDYLASYGVAATRVTTISYGEERPAEMCSDETCWSRNRRVEFTTSF